ncbi:MAG: VanZ family protein [Phycisphaerae bacterium]
MPHAGKTRTSDRLQAVLAVGLLAVSAFVLLTTAGPQVCSVWVWLAVAPAAVGYLLVRRPRWSLGLPLWCGLIGAVGALLMVMSNGSGASPWQWPSAAVTLGVAYAALLLTLASAVVGSLELRPARDAVRSVPLLLLAAAPWAVLAYLVLEGTDALGLAWRVRAEPLPGGVFLVLLVFLVGLNGAAVGYALRFPRFGFVALLLLGTFLLLGVGYLLAGLALEPDSLAGPESVAAGAPPSPGPGLPFLRWAAVQLGAVWFLALGHWMVLSLAGRSAARAKEDASAAAERREEEGSGTAAAAPGRLYAVLAVVYAVLVVYGLLVPLEYRHRPFEEALEAFAATPYLDLGVANRADLVANLLLFIPLGFFVMGALTREDTRPGRWLMAGLTLTGAAVLSLAVEFLQLYFPPRTVSWNDVLAEWVGALVGTGLWLAAGAGLTRWWRRAMASARPSDVARQLLTAYVVGLFLYQLFPFDVVLSAEELAMQADQGKIVFRPFSETMPDAVLAAKVLALVPVGYWVVVRRNGGRLPVLGAAFVGAVYVAAIEVLQVFVFSRYSSATDVVLGAGGSLVGGMLAIRMGPAAAKPLPQGLGRRAIAWLVRLGMTAALVAAWVRAKWAPLDLHWPEQGLLAALAERVHVPFYYQYWNSEFEAVAQLLRDVAAPAVLGLLLVSLIPSRVPGRRVAAGAAAAAVGAGLELGQIAFPPHVPDVTTAVLAAGGGVAGVYLYGPFVRAFIHPGGADDTDVGLEDPT